MPLFTDENDFTSTSTARFIAEFDHKPMEAIQLKNCSHKTVRDALEIKLYDITINYRPGKQMQVADVLSRLSSEKDAAILDLNVKIDDESPEISSGYLQKIQAETAKDPELVALKGVVSTIRKIPKTKPSPPCQQRSDPRRSVCNKKRKEGEGTFHNERLNKHNT